jgi:hypothetical protein
MYDQEESAISSYAQRLLDEGYPPGVLMIDTGISDITLENIDVNLANERLKVAGVKNLRIENVTVVVNALPGTYMETLYDVELAVALKRVTIDVGKTTTADIAATLPSPPAIFRIGTWDGMPHGFLNADKIADHHPSDSCMKPFTDGNFVVGKSTDVDWPLGEWLCP